MDVGESPAKRGKAPQAAEIPKMGVKKKNFAGKTAREPACSK